MLVGDYSEIEHWIIEGRVDCGFIRLPIKSELETIVLHQDPLLAVMPIGHPLTKKPNIRIKDLCKYPFMLLEKGANTEISEVFTKAKSQPNTHFTTWDDYAIMSMVESGMGIAVLHQLILLRTPYKIEMRELDPPIFRTIGFAYKKNDTGSHAVSKFIEYLEFREKL